LIPGSGFAGFNLYKMQHVFFKRGTTRKEKEMDNDNRNVLALASVI